MALSTFDKCSFIAQKMKKSLGVNRQISKSGFSESIVHVINHVSFQLYRAHPDEVIWRKVTIDDKHISNQVGLFIHQTMSSSGVEKKKNFWT